MKSSTADYTFDYTLGEAIWLTSFTGDELLPRGSLEILKQKVVDRLKRLAYSTKWDPLISLLPDTPKGSTYKKGSKP